MINSLSAQEQNIPEVDVIILSWNRLKDTLDAVDSIQNQKMVYPRICLVDQGSDKETVEILRGLSVEHQNISLLEMGTNLGVGAGRNRGILSGGAEVIVSIDNDATLINSLALHKVVEKFELMPSLAALGFKISRYDTRDLDFSSWVYPRSLLSNMSQEFKATRFCGAGHALRRSAIQRSKGYDERLFFYWEELDLSYKLINDGYEILYFPQVEILHKISDENRKRWKQGRYYYLVRNALYLDWKYFQSSFRILQMGLGYQVKGIYNGVMTQSLKGFLDALKMIRDLPRSEVTPLSEQARQYITENDLRYRGNLWQRFRSEIMEQLPS